MLPWLLLLAVSAVPVGLVMSPVAHRQADVGTALTLDTDAGSSPLFRADRMSPGAVVTNCVRVRFQGANPSGALGVYASANDSGLAPLLGMTVEAGQGGGFGNCTGFVPSGTVYSGTLADFASAHGDPSRSLPVDSLTGTGAVSFRFVFHLDDRSMQGLHAEATFGWTAQQGAQLPSPSPDASRQVSTGPAPATAAPVLPGPSTNREPRGGTTSAAAAPQGAQPTTQGIAALVPKLVSHVLVPAGKAGSVTLPMVLVVGGFLLLQNRIDRRDPKLATADVERAADLEFVDRSEIRL